jgi:DNA topoisomerase VI subunit A
MCVYVRADTNPHGVSMYWCVAVGSTAGQSLSASHQAHSRQTPSPLAQVPGNLFRIQLRV